MSRFIINGGNPLSGEVSIRGAKNASFKQIIASLLSSKKTRLHNVPVISDVKITQSIAQSLGTNIKSVGEHCLDIQTKKILKSTVPQGTGSQSRTSFIFAAPLLVRTKKAIIPLPGGDKLGARPLDRLFDCYRSMNINTKLTQKQIIFTTDQIKPTNYSFKKPSHTATEVAIMTAVLTPGTTTLKNTALEPEIDDLITMLNSMGAIIKRQPQNPKTITIKGVKQLSGADHQVIPDRNEAVTFACAALATKGSVNILNIDPQLLTTFNNIIKKIGAQVETGANELKISWTKPLKACHIETQPHPGFMTDWQALFTVVLTQAVGSSTIIERVWPYRFHHVSMLTKMGAKLKLFNPPIENPKSYYFFNPESDQPKYFHGLKIYGPAKLKGAEIAVNDLRAGACVTLAALTAQGQSTINNVELIQRGYEKLADRLWSLGADIKHIKTSS